MAQSIFDMWRDVSSRYGSTMPILRNSLPRTLATILALLVFSGDVLDDVWTPAGSTAVQSSQSSGPEKSPAPGKGSTSYDDTVVINSPLDPPTPTLPTAFKYLDLDEAAPAGAPPSIDHPPQLA